MCQNIFERMCAVRNKSFSGQQLVIRLDTIEPETRIFADDGLGVWVADLDSEVTDEFRDSLNWLSREPYSTVQSYDLSDINDLPPESSIHLALSMIDFEPVGTPTIIGHLNYVNQMLATLEIDENLEDVAPLRDMIDTICDALSTM